MRCQTAPIMNDPEGIRSQFEVRRFTREEHAHGDTVGWCFETGWFHRNSGLRWAWFSREDNDGKAHEDDP